MTTPVTRFAAGMLVILSCVLFNAQTARADILVPPKYYNEIKFVVGNSTFYINQKPAALDALPFIAGGRAYIPVRSLLVAIGIPDGSITWDPSAQSVEFPYRAGVSIGVGAFEDCTGLTSVTIPDTVRSIGDAAFSACSSLASITIPDSVTAIGASAFDGCKNITICGPANSYTERYAKSNGIPFRNIATAAPNQFAVLVNGNRAVLQAYTIDGGNYFKLRDVAKVLSETRKHFDVTWDGASNEIYIYSDVAYSEVGGELIPAEDAVSRTASITTSKIYLNNNYHEVGFTAYNIGGNNYFKLSDLAEALDFYIASGSANTIEIDTSAGFSATGNKIYYSDNTLLSDEPVTGVKSSISVDLDGDGKDEAAEIVVSQDEGKKWTLDYKDGKSEDSVPIFKGNENGFSTSIAAGHIISSSTIDFLVSAELRSMPFGGASYELYSLKDGVFTKIDVSGITDGTEFDVSVDENKKTAKLMSNGSEKTVDLSGPALSGYKRYGKGFCSDFFVGMRLKSVEGSALPELVTTEVIAAVLPDNLTYLHTTYRYIDGAWRVHNVEFYDFD